MAVIRRKFSESFSYFPTWSCGRCLTGNISEMKDSRRVVETGPSKRDQNNPDWEPDWVRERFSLFAECDKCGDIVAITGDTSTFYDVYEDPDGKIDADYRRMFHIRSMFPATPLFDIPKQTPEDVKKPYKVLSLSYGSTMLVALISCE